MFVVEMMGKSRNFMELRVATLQAYPRIGLNQIYTVLKGIIETKTLPNHEKRIKTLVMAWGFAKKSG